MVLTKIGGVKIAAAKLGISVEQYQQNVKSGLKRCFSCQTWVQVRLFNQDASSRDGKDNRCRSCRKAFDALRARKLRQRYDPVQNGISKPPRFPPKPGRDGDKNQARNRVNYAVTRNKLPRDGVYSEFSNDKYNKIGPILANMWSSEQVTEVRKMDYYSRGK